MCLYQFLIMIRDNQAGSYGNMTNEDGQVTSHIIGMLTRTLKLMEAGIKPVYVFDGKPPELKGGELEARRAKRVEAQEKLEEAKSAGDNEAIQKGMKLTTRVTKEQNEQTKTLLKLMGVPVINAPCEAEATCAALCRDGKVYGSATEDADCLTFGTKVLIRNLMAAESQKKQIFEIDLKVALEQLNISMEQFIDFCILCGCDYTGTLKGVGPSTAIKMIVQHGSIEKILENIEADKVPADFNYKGARQAFLDCEAVDTSTVDLKWEEPDLDGLTKFLVEQMTFQPERVERYVERLKQAKTKTKQRPLSSFFGQPKVQVKDSDKFDPNKKKASAKAKAGDKRKMASPAAGSAKRAK